MIEQLILKIILILIDSLVSGAEDRARTKKAVMDATIKYNDHVLDSAKLRREWDDLKRAFDEPRR
jgi:hypothetical protein